MLILVSAVGFGCGLNYREFRPFWLPLTVWMDYRFTGGEVLLFVRRLPAIPVTVLYRRSVGGKFLRQQRRRCDLFWVCSKTEPGSDFSRIYRRHERTCK